MNPIKKEKILIYRDDTGKTDIFKTFKNQQIYQADYVICFQPYKNKLTLIKDRYRDPEFILDQLLLHFSIKGFIISDTEIKVSDIDCMKLCLKL